MIEHIMTVEEVRKARTTLKNIAKGIRRGDFDGLCLEDQEALLWKIDFDLLWLKACVNYRTPSESLEQP